MKYFDACDDVDFTGKSTEIIIAIKTVKLVILYLLITNTTDSSPTKHFEILFYFISNFIIIHLIFFSN